MASGGILATSATQNLTVYIRHSTEEELAGLEVSVREQSRAINMWKEDNAVAILCTHWPLLHKHIGTSENCENPLEPGPYGGTDFAKVP